MPYFAPDYFDPGWFDALLPAPAPAPEEESPLAEGDYFDCDYFDPTYFDTPDCEGDEPTGGRGGRVRLFPIPEALEDPDELLALI